MPVGGRRPNSGRKPGGQNDNEWRDAIRIAVHERTTGKRTTKLRELADKIVAAGLAGDIAAIKEIGDRLDGKPHQQTILTGKNDGPVQFQGLDYVITPAVVTNGATEDTDSGDPVTTH